MGVPPNGSFMIEYPIEMDDLGVPLFYFRKPSYYMYMYIYIYNYICIVTSIKSSCKYLELHPVKMAASMLDLE